MARWVVGSILHGVDPLSYFSTTGVTKISRSSQCSTTGVTKAGGNDVDDGDDDGNVIESSI